MLVIPAALLKLEKVLAASNTVILDLRHVSSWSWIPSLTSRSFQRHLNFRWRALPLRHKDNCGVAPRKDVVLQPTLRVGVK